MQIFSLGNQLLEMLDPIIWHFMQIFSLGNQLLEMLDPIFW